MTEKENLKVNTVSAPSPTVEVSTNQQQQAVEKIRGILTSRIEVKPSSDIPAYGFFKFEDKEIDIPVVFRIKENNSWIKPQIKKGSTCELAGYFVDSKENPRPSFTATSYHLVEESNPLNTKDLITLTSGLLSTSLEKKKEWVNRTDFLFKELDELKEITPLTKISSHSTRSISLSAKSSNGRTRRRA